MVVAATGCVVSSYVMHARLREIESRSQRLKERLEEARVIRRVARDAQDRLLAAQLAYERMLIVRGRFHNPEGRERKEARDTLCKAVAELQESLNELNTLNIANQTAE